MGRSQFLDLYPICSQLIADIGRDFIRSWSVEQANEFREKFVQQLVDGGCSHGKAASAWQLVVQDHAKSDGLDGDGKTQPRGPANGTGAVAEARSEFLSSSANVLHEENVFFL